MQIARSLLLLISLLASSSAHSQNVVQVFHGNKGETQLLGYKGSNSAAIVVESGEDVCMHIVNAHPGLYTYKFISEVVETTIEVPDLGPLIPLLSVLLDLPPGDAQTSPTGRTRTGGWSDLYLVHLDTLKAQIERAQVAIQKSDRAEGIPDATNLVPGSTGFRWARRYIENMPARRGSFNSPTLKSDVEGWHQTATNAANAAGTTSREEKLLLEMYRSYGTALLAAVNVIKTAYLGDEATPIIRHCIKIEDLTTIKLKAEARTGDARLRDTGDAIVTVTAQPNYDRPALELVPVAALAYTNDVPLFSLEEGVVVEGEDDGFRFRPGAMLVYNLPSFGYLNRGAVGLGLGYAYSSEGNQLENLYVGGLLSYADVFRIGIGIGKAQYPDGLMSPAKVGASLPSEISDLDDLLVYKSKLSFFITFTVLGLDIPLIK